MKLSLVDRIGTSLVKRAEEFEKAVKDLDEFDVQILNVCNVPRTDSHIKQMFRSRDTEGTTVNFDHRIQRLMKGGFLDRAHNKYVVNPKYRKFITVIPMSASRKLAEEFEEVLVRERERGESSEDTKSIPKDALEIIRDMAGEYEVDVILDEVFNLDSMIEAGFDSDDFSDERRVKDIIKAFERVAIKVKVDMMKSKKEEDDEYDLLEADGFISKDSLDIGLGMGIVDRTDSEEQRESLISPKVSVKIPVLKKKSKNSRELKQEHRKQANKVAASYLSSFTEPPVITPSNVAFKATAFVRRFLSNYRFPLYPDIKFVSSRNASNSPDKFSGEATISVIIPTLSGIKQRADIVLPVLNGEFLEPSTFSVNGNVSIISQSAIDDIVRQATFYTTVSNGDIYSGPSDKKLVEKAKDTKIPKVNLGIFSI